MNYNYCNYSIKVGRQNLQISTSHTILVDCCVIAVPMVQNATINHIDSIRDEAAIDCCVWGLVAAPHPTKQLSDCTRTYFVLCCTCLALIVVCFAAPPPPTRTNNCLVMPLRPLRCRGSHCAWQASNSGEGFIDSTNQSPSTPILASLMADLTTAATSPATEGVWEDRMG